MVLDRIALAVVLLGAIACGGSKGEKDTGRSRPDGSTADAAGTGSVGSTLCRNVTPKANAAVAATRGVLSGFDLARTKAFTYSTPVPTAPVEPAADPGATSFAATPAQADYRRARAAYEREVQKIGRERGRYVAQFEKDWGQLDLKGKQKPSKLAAAVQTVPPVAACRVVDVEGKCSKACFDTESYSPRTRGWPELIESACNRRPLVEGYAWVHTCRAKVTCEAGEPLSNATPGLEYTSGTYAIVIAKKYVADEAGAADFQKRIGAVRPCDVLAVPSIGTWRFRETWVGETTPDDGWPETILD